MTAHVGCFSSSTQSQDSTGLELAPLFSQDFHISEVISRQLCSAKHVKNSGMGFMCYRHELIYSGRYHSGCVLQVCFQVTRQISMHTKLWLIISSFWFAFPLDILHGTTRNKKSWLKQMCITSIAFTPCAYQFRHRKLENIDVLYWF